MKCIIWGLIALLVVVGTAATEPECRFALNFHKSHLMSDDSKLQEFVKQTMYWESKFVGLAIDT